MPSCVPAPAEALDTLDAAIKRTSVAHQLVETQLQRNEIIRAALRQAEAQAKPAPAPAPKSPGGEAKGRPAERLNSQMPDVTGAGEQTPLQLALVDWINAQAALEVTVLGIERSIAALERKYQTLAGDSALTAALERIGNLRLGPAKDYRRNNRLIAAQGFFSARQPIFRESGALAHRGGVNERTPATFSFVEQSRPTFITTTLAESLGLEADSREPANASALASAILSVRRVTLPSLRLGKFVFRDVPVLLLPPEAEDLGSQLASGSLAGCRARLKAQRMSLDLEMVSAGRWRAAQWLAVGRPPGDGL